eukprot:1142151-Pelagomonas_calceolata.AAC.3
MSFTHPWSCRVVGDVATKHHGVTLKVKSTLVGITGLLHCMACMRLRQMKNEKNKTKQVRRPHALRRGPQTSKLPKVLKP